MHPKDQQDSHPSNLLTVTKRIGKSVCTLAFTLATSLTMAHDHGGGEPSYPDYDPNETPAETVAPASQNCKIDAFVDSAPKKLSRTGCVAEGDVSSADPGMTAYGVNEAFWANGATQGRYISLPPGEAIVSDEAGQLSFPVGTV
jgi:hypothetical protein